MGLSRNQFGTCMIIFSGVGLFTCFTLTAQVQDPKAKPTREPIFRVARLDSGAAKSTEDTTADSKSKEVHVTPKSTDGTPPVASVATPHPLDAAIEIATERLATIRHDIQDYQAIMVKRERIDGTLNEPEFMKVKIRNRRTSDNGQQTPFSVYMRFLKPKAIRGREVIYVEGRNDGKLVAHDTGLKGLLTVYLDPTGWMAMQNSRHPIYEAGLENLVVKLIEKAERDKAAGMCQVDYVDDAKINDRPCTKIKVVHDEQRAPYDFHIAEVFIDKELQLPVRYAAYDWPATRGGEPPLLEEYTYLNLELNVGLTDKDFDKDNSDYDYR